MRQRKFIVLVGGAMAWPLAAHAQQAAKLPTIMVEHDVADETDAQPAPTSSGTVTRTIDSGLELVLSRPAFWDSGCNARGVTVTITQPPAHGTVSVREGLRTIQRNPKFGTSGRCVGKQVMGKVVVYRSKPGFRGSDVVVYEYVSDRGERAAATVIITVR